MSSVIGIANQMKFAGAIAGKRRIRIPLMTAPRATDTIKEVAGCINA